MDRRAPHRFRPYNRGTGPEPVLRGLTQVTGHSAEELHGAQSAQEVLRGKWRGRDVAKVGLHLIDLCYRVRQGTDRCRYAVIEDGSVTVHED